jgi:glycosyltransferase A (GT-A) superfamily protein (DUF2064 family)
LPATPDDAGIPAAPIGGETGAVRRARGERPARDVMVAGGVTRRAGQDVLHATHSFRPEPGSALRAGTGRDTVRRSAGEAPVMNRPHHLSRPSRRTPDTARSPATLTTLGRTTAARLIVAAAFVAVPAVFAAPASAQKIEDIRTAADPTAFKSNLATVVSEGVARLKGTDAAEAVKARDALIAPVVPPGATPAFFELYSDVLATGLAPLADANVSVQARLNAAIAAAKVAEKTESIRLAPLIKKQLADPNPSVVLWALKAARPIVLKVLNDPILAKNNDLLPDVLAAVKKHGAALGPVVVEGYRTIGGQLADRATRNAMAKATVAKVTPPVVDAMYQVAAMRAEIYKAGSPADPAAERVLVDLITDAAVWNTLTPAQKLQGAQSMLDFMSFSIQRAGRVTSQTERVELLTLAQYTAKAISALGISTNNQPVQEALRDVVTASVTGTPPAQFLQFLSDVPAALQTLDGCKGVKDPQQISASPATTTSSAK